MLLWALAWCYYLQGVDDLMLSLEHRPLTYGVWFDVVFKVFDSRTSCICSVTWMESNNLYVVWNDQKRPFWVVYKGLLLGIHDSWLKAALQVNGVPWSSHKKSATFFEALDIFTAYCTFKSERVNHEPQAYTITDEEVDKVADELTKIWLGLLPTDLPMLRTLLRPRE